jgi:DNA-binding PadR family transcriptional regulator
MQTSLRRLEGKGFLKSAFGEVTKVRGGKRKRFFTLTHTGKQALREAKEQRLGLWNAVPEFLLNCTGFRERRDVQSLLSVSSPSPTNHRHSRSY